MIKVVATNEYGEYDQVSEVCLDAVHRRLNDTAGCSFWSSFESSGLVLSIDPIFQVVEKHTLIPEIGLPRRHLRASCSRHTQMLVACFCFRARSEEAFYAKCSN